MAQYGLRKFIEPASYSREASDQDPQNLKVRLALTHSCLRTNQYQCDLDACREILILNAASAGAGTLAGEALDELRQYD
jgi:hypothetical protein